MVNGDRRRGGEAAATDGGGRPRAQEHAQHNDEAGRGPEREALSCGIHKPAAISEGRPEAARHARRRAARGKT